MNDNKFSQFLQYNSKLQYLSLKSCRINDLGLSNICDVLKENKILKSLDLYGNEFESLVPLAEMLEVNRSLMHLSLAKNNLTDEKLLPLVGSFGKIPFPDERADEFRQKEKDKMKVKSSKPKSMANADPPSDELIIEEESKQTFLVKNKVFARLNISLNRIENDRQLRLLLIQALPHFKIIISGNPIPELIRKPLLLGFLHNLVIN